MTGKLEENIGNDIQQSVGSKSDSFLSGREFENIKKNAKQKVQILEILDELEFSEYKQDELLQKILKYNLIDNIKEALDQEEILILIKEKEKEKEKEEKEKERKKIEEKALEKEKKYNKLSSKLEKIGLFKEKKEEKVQEHEEKVQEHEEKVQEHKDDLENFNKNEEKIRKVLDSVNGLSEGNPVYGNIILKIKNFDTEKYKDESPEKVLEAFNKIISGFKQNPEKLQAVAKDLKIGSVEYEDFKSSLISVDSDFGKYFRDIEDIDLGNSLPTTEVENGIENESGGIIDLRLGENPPVYDIRMIGSNYNFENEINKQELGRITKDSEKELNEINNNGFKILKDFNTNFIKNDYDISKMDDLYDYFDIDSNLQINQNDLEDFKNAENSDEKLKIFAEKIKPKIDTIVKIVTQKQQEVLKQYKEEIKEIIKKQQEKQEIQKETLKFLHSIGFDLIPKKISDKVINQINLAKGLFGLTENIDLANGNLGFKTSSLEDTQKTDNLNDKQKFAEIVNIMLSGEKGRPINIKTLGGIGQPQFIGKNGETKDYLQIKKEILKNLGSFQKSVIDQNIENFKKLNIKN